MQLSQRRGIIQGIWDCTSHRICIIIRREYIVLEHGRFARSDRQGGLFEVVWQPSLASFRTSISTLASPPRPTFSLLAVPSFIFLFLQKRVR